MDKNTNIFRVILCKQYLKTKVSPNLSWIQRLVCKWFKITPESKFNYKLCVIIEDGGKVRPNSMLMDSAQYKWRVVSATPVKVSAITNQTMVVLQNLEPMYPHFTGIKDHLALIYSQYMEGDKI